MKKWLIILLVFSAVGCNEEKITFPYRPVYLEIDLTYAYHNLQRPYMYEIFTSYRGLSIGLGGVIVFHGEDFGSGAYHAYDLACPYEESATTLLSIDESRMNAVCPECNSIYELPYGGYGNPNNTHRKSLRSYNIQRVKTGTSEKLIVQN